MPVEPGYGETPLEPDEADALTPAARAIFGEAPLKVELFDAEQVIADEISVQLLQKVADGSLSLNELLSAPFLRTLHAALYGDLWQWAGRFRTRELNIGVAPGLVATELHESLGTIRYRWEHTGDWTPRELAVHVHAEIVRIHPFVDGNGRSTRLLADLVFFAVQDPEDPLEALDWEVDKRRYIELLREYDVSRDARDLARFVGVVGIED